MKTFMISNFWIKRLFFLILIVTTVCMNPLLAQLEEEEEVFQLTSPYHTIYAFLANLQSDNFNPSVAATALNFGDNTSSNEKEKLAIKLIQILDGRGLLVDLDELPKDSEYTDSLTNRQRYVLFQSLPEVYVEKYGDVWLFSRRTVRNIPELHQEIYPLGLDRLLEILPQGANKKFLGLTTWQYIGIGIVFLLALALHRILTYFFGILLLRFLKRFEQGEAIVRKLVSPIARPISLLVLFLILLGIIPSLGLPVSLNRFILLSLRISAMVFAIMIALRFVDFGSAYAGKVAARTKGTLDDQLTPLLSKTIKVVIVMVGILYILQALDFDITTLLTGLSIGTLAFALAAQDTIKNLFGSITIFLDRPFQVGDWVVASGIDGTIEEVGFRSTRVRTFANSVVYVPNGRLADMTIDNMGLRRYRRYRTMLSLTYDTPPALMRAFISGVRQLIINHPDTRKDYYHVYLNNMGATSLDILVYTFFEVPDWSAELKCRHDLIIGFLELAEELGVRYAFPTQTIHIEDLPGQKSLTPEYSQQELKNENAYLTDKVHNFVDGYYQSTPKAIHRGKDSGINEGDG